MDYKKLTEELKRDEGMILHAYQDNMPEKYWTIGIGRLIDQRKGGGITVEEAEFLLQNDIKKVAMQLSDKLPWFLSLPDNVQRALCNMCFQMGINSLLGFKTTLLHVANGNYKQAALNAKKSLWYKQTPERASRVIALLEKG